MVSSRGYYKSPPRRTRHLTDSSQDLRSSFRKMSSHKLAAWHQRTCPTGSLHRHRHVPAPPAGPQGDRSRSLFLHVNRFMCCSSTYGRWASSSHPSWRHSSSGSSWRERSTHLVLKVSPSVHVWSSESRSWRWSYGVGTMFGVVVTLLIAFFMEET